MSIHHLERAGELDMAPVKKLIFMAMCDDAQKETGLTFPGLDKMTRWANGKSKSYILRMVKELIDEGYVERKEEGRKGRRAVYQVFAHVACCIEHGPMSKTAWNVGVRPVHPTDDTPVLGSTKGSTNGSTPGFTPPVSPVSTHNGEPSNVTNSAPVDNSPQPPKNVIHPDRCAQHQRVEFPPKCLACKSARVAAEAQREAAKRAAMAAEVEGRREAARAARAAIDACDLCDVKGYYRRRPCSHDRVAYERQAELAAEWLPRLRQGRAS